MTSAIDRFKMLLANALEQVCVLQEQLELARAQIKLLETLVPGEEEGKYGGTEDGNREASGPNRESASSGGSAEEPG
jgi:hypothetical protein